MEKIISLRDAERSGLKHYFTGKPCNHGHLAPRYVSTWRCVVCTKDRVVKWQRENPEKSRAKNKRYYDRYPERILAGSRRDHETTRQRRNKQREAISGRAKPEVCDICDGKDARDKIVWDHCHTGGHFRGWLCDRCNKTIGAAEDNPALLRKMANYLERDQKVNGGAD